MGDYKKALSMIMEYNKGDVDYYVRKVKLLLLLGKKNEPLFPTFIARERYGVKDLEDFTNSNTRNILKMI